MFFIVLSLGAFILAILYAIEAKEMPYSYSDYYGILMLYGLYAFIMFIRESYRQIIDGIGEDTYSLTNKTQIKNNIYAPRQSSKAQYSQAGITNKIIEPYNKYVEIPITTEDLKKHDKEENSNERA